MRPFGALLPFKEALALIESNTEPVSRIESIRLDDSIGRVLGSDVVASMNVPAFDRSTMDGYAVRAEDTFGAGQFNPKTLEVVSPINAGDVPSLSITTGKCMQISTGAMLPPGADSVVMVEDTESDGPAVRIFKPSYPKANVSKAGDDIKLGSVVLKAGSIIDPRVIGVLASQGLSKVNVFARPTIAVIPSGEEVMPLGRKLKKAQLYDINSHTLSALVNQNGGEAYIFQVMGDRPDVVRGTIAEALQFDFIVVSGGSSVGERDLLSQVISGWGQILFHGIQVRPGKPTLFSIVEGKPLVGMPGNPTSCLTNAYLLLLPAVRKMARLPPLASRTVTVPLSRRIQGTVGRRQFLTVRIENGQAVLAFRESGYITSIANADGYIEIPENVDNVEKGELVTVTLF